MMTMATMMTTIRLADALPSLILLALTGVFLLCFYLKIRVQPDRLRLAELGKRLLATGDLSPKMRHRVIFCLDHAFGLRLYLAASLPILPFAAVYYVAKHSFADILDEELQPLPHATADLFREFDQIDTKLFVANNPILVGIATVIVGLTLLAAWPVVVLARAISLVTDGIRFPATLSLTERVLGLVLLRMGDALESVNNRLVHAGHRILPRVA